MARQRTRTLLVAETTATGGRRRPDELVEEEPMAIELDGVRVATTMRTPGHDFELAVGFCHAEGLLAGAPVTEVRYCATGSAVETGFNIVTVSSGGLAKAPVARLGTTTSSCGFCGSLALDELTTRLAPLPAEQLALIGLDVVRAVATAAPQHQPLFRRTGAVHGALAFTHDGAVAVAREDVGRHNAVDKVVGRLLLDGMLPAYGLGLFVSGRASFEIVQKAWAAGFGTVVAVSAPTALAVDTARRAGITLAGFLRDDRVNVYSPERPGWA